MSTTTTQTEGLLIDGARVDASDGQTFDVFDPSTGERLATVAKATKADVSRAVASAQAALESKTWGGLAPAERGRIMWRIAGAIRERAEELATLESRDNGKPLRQARTDVQVAARYFEFFAGIADKIMGNTIPLGPGFLDYTVREPIGVSAQIVPWNYPIQIGARGVAPALAAGCTVVLKPSSEAPMTALRLGEIGLACGLPPGVLNVIPGTGSEAGTALASHPGHQSVDVHRLGRRRRPGRQDGCRKRRPRRHGTRRQVTERRVRRRGLRPGRGGRRQCDLPERRADLLGRIPPARRTQGSRRLRRAPRRAREDDDHRPWCQRSRHGPDHLEASARNHRTLCGGRQGRRRDRGGRRQTAMRTPHFPVVSTSSPRCSTR